MMGWMTSMPLLVTLHLNNGVTITQEMTLQQKQRISRTLNQAVLPVTPYETTVDDAHYEIPWRSISHISFHSWETLP